ncbi:MAG: C40 family peptidase [Faecalibacterium sp.]
MEYGIFTRAVVTIYDLPRTTKQGEDGLLSAIGDEGLYGQVCQVRTLPGGVTAEGVCLPDDMAEICTFYGYHGYVFYRELRILSERELREYLSAALVMTGRAMDVQSGPRVAAVRLMELERGALLRRLPETDPTPGWAKAALADGREGYVRDVALEPVRYAQSAVLTQRPGLPFDMALARAEGCKPEMLTARILQKWHGGSETAFRTAVIEAAKKYLGAEYRWGGKSGRGIDCSGLVSSAYMQCGVLIYRDAKLMEGWPMHAIPFEEKQPADALFFPGHIALYLGEGLYLHSTGAAASGGVVYNSLDPKSALYREDLAKSLYAVGSIF